MRLTVAVPAILGHETVYDLFPNGMDPVGQEVKVKDMKYKVIGVIKREGQSFFTPPKCNDFSGH